MEFRYTKQFDRLSKTTLFKLRGPTLLVEVLPKEEIKTSGGIYIGKTATQRATAEDFRRGLGIVLLQGEGYTDGSCMDITKGMIVQLPYNPMYLSEFPGLVDYTQNTLALINEGDVLFAYKSYADYVTAKELLAWRGEAENQTQSKLD